MVRAILRNGTIQPVDPLPESWADGVELRIDAADPMDDPAEVARWVREMNDPDFGIPGDDFEIMMRAINEHRQEQKELMRKRLEAE